MSKPNKRTLLSGIAIFILLPLLIGVLMYARTLSVLHHHMEHEVSTQITLWTRLASLRLSSHLDELERVAGYLRDGQVAEADMGDVVSRLLSAADRGSIGVLRLGGEPVSGQALEPGEYPAIQRAFRGDRAVRYRKGEGMILTAPIYNGENIKYVLYEFFEEKDLFVGFGEGWFGGGGLLLLADSQQQVYMPLAASSREDVRSLFQRESVREAVAELSDKLKYSASAAVYCKTGGEAVFLSTAELTQANLYLVGVAPHEVVAGELGGLTPILLAVFGVLQALLVTGVVRIISADARARESDELRAAKEEAEDANASKGRFLASMSHELRTPINTIMGMNEMILRETREKYTRERAMDVKSAAQILLNLINDVLDFSKIESGMLAILPAEYDLTGLIRDLALLSDNRARTKSLIFTMDIQPELPIRLYGDDVRLQQVLTNLLANAVKYTNEGSVTLRMSGKGIDGDELLLHCEVEDTGIGIKPEDLEKLKDLTPFTRLDESRNRKVEGSGLGLPIIVNLLRLMNSRLQVESVYGYGSKFFFDIPQQIVNDEPIGEIKQRLEQAAVEYEYRVAFVAPRAKVMVVDDNALNRKIFVSLLNQTRIQIAAVSSGQKCLDLAKKERFDLIFMDHLMPEMDGLETLRRLQEMEGNLCKDTPVIALTANAFSGARELFLSAGFDAYLSKPIVPEKLEALLLKKLPEDYIERIEPQIAEAEVELPELEGVNWDYALLHLQSKGLLLEAIRDFARGLDGERRDIEALAREIGTPEGLSNYRTRVHALKSTAAAVGVLQLSTLAKLLEAAVYDGDQDRIDALAPILLDELAQTRERLSPLLETQQVRKPAPGAGQLTDLLEMLLSALDAMDINSADALMSQLNGYAYEDEVQAHMDELAGAVSSLDFDTATELAQARLEQIRENEAS